MATEKKTMAENLLFSQSIQSSTQGTQNTQGAQNGPNFTVRALVTDINGESPKQLKPFSHFTLGCSEKDEAPIILKGMLCLALMTKLSKNNLCLTVDSVVNLGDDAKPLWALKLKEEEILGINMRRVFGELFDKVMCKERNGVCYQWQAKEPQNLKCPHITMGPKEEDRLLANSLIGKKIAFNYLDYKRVGPHDPHVRFDLGKFNTLIKEGKNESEAMKISLQLEKSSSDELFVDALSMVETFLKSKEDIGASRSTDRP